MDESEKCKFEELFEKLAEINNHLSEEFLKTLIAFLDTNVMKYTMEVFKYKVYYLVVNRVKINELIKNFGSGCEKLKEKMRNLVVESEEIFGNLEKPLPLINIYKSSFQLIFENFKINNNLKIGKNEISQKIEINKNEKINEKLNEIPHKQVEKENPVTITNPFIDNNSKNSENLRPSQNNLIASKDIKTNPVPSLSILAKPPSQQPLPEKTISTFEMVRKNSASSVSSTLSAESNKLNEESKNKIDSIFNLIKTEEEMLKFINSYMNDKPFDIYSHHGFFLENNSNRLRILPIEYKLKILTIFAKLSFILSAKQKQGVVEKFKKEILSDSLFEEKSLDIILNLLLDPFKNRTNNNILYNLITKAFKKESNLDDLHKLIEGAKTFYDISDLFYLFSLNSIYFFMDELTHYKLLFLLYLQLTKNPKFDTENSYELLYSLYIIRLFFGSHRNRDKNKIMEILKVDENTGEVMYENKNLVKINKKKKINFKFLFNENNINFCEKIISVIRQFYNIGREEGKFYNRKSLAVLFNPKNYKFTMNIVELFINKEKFIYDNRNTLIFKKNLIKLERQLFDTFSNFVSKSSADNYYKESIPQSQNPNDKFYSVFLYKDQLSAFRKIEEEITHLIAYGKYDISVQLFPFGSITQFLGNSDSDLDIYMMIEGDKQEKLRFMNHLWNQIYKYENGADRVITKRLATITYQNKDNVKIDLNYFGTCSVLNSALLRVYAQCDERFVILAHNLKYILKALDINNSDKGKIYLNSFCWMILLVTFLQDVVQPPVLPKILSNCHASSKKIEAARNLKKEGEKPEKKDKAKFYQKTRKFDDIVLNTSPKEYDLNDSFTEQFPIIYKNFISNLECKNEMSLSELFVKFLEFVIFYFKYDSLFVHSSFGGECFMNRSDFKILEFKDRNFYDNLKYLLKKDKGEILIREPFDHGYNPAQTMQKEKANELNNRLKNYYFNVIQKGEI
jgi:hypothetical protein